MNAPIKPRENPLDKLTPELGGKLVKAVADDMVRARRATEEKKAKKAKKQAEKTGKS
jgi:hypothetical protein